MSDYKMHFKMYKSGKLWIVAGIVSLSLLGGGVKAYADTETNSQTATQNATTIPVSSAQIQQTAETSTVDSSSSSVKDEQASTMSESATVVAKQEQSLASQQTTTDAQNNNVVPNNNVQNTTVAKDTQSATTNASDSNTTVQVQTGTLPVNQVSGTTEVHQDGHWYLKDFQGNYLNGWQKLTDNRIVYYDPQTSQMQYGEHQINNQWYYFDTNCGAVVQGWYVLADGRKVYYDVANDGTGRGMLHGIQTINGQTYNFNIYTGAQTSGWKIIDGQKYYFAPAMVHGMEKQIDGHWYCFDDMGRMLTGFVRLNDGREVYYNADGQMQYSEQKINDKWYHFQTNNGNMARGWYTLEDGRRVYYDVDADGSGAGMLHGLNQINNQSYYFDASDGDEKIGLQVVDNQTYYFNPIMVKNGEAKIGNHWYYFNAAGQMQTGFVTLKDGRLVYYNADGQMQYGEQKINDKWYHFQTDNGDTARGWYTLEDGRWVYYDVDNSGAGQGMLHGMQKVGNDYYYFNPGYGTEETGLKTVNGQQYYFAPTMVVNQEEHLADHWYYFGANGQMQTGFVTLKDGRLVYYNADGQMQYGEQKINGKWYHFQTDNGNTARGWYTLEDGRQVYYDVDDTGNGQGMLHGLGKVGDDYYYFNDATGAKETGLKTLNGQTYNFAGNNGQALLSQFWTNDNQTYYFDQQGQMVKNQHLTIDGEQWRFDANGVGTKVAVKIADNWNFDKKSSAELNNLGNIEGTTGEYNGLLIDASKPGAKFSPRDAGDTQVNANTVISVPVKANQYGAKVTISGTANGQTLTLDGQAVTLGQAINVDSTSAHYLKLLVNGTGSAYLTDIVVDYGSDQTNDFPGTLPTGKSEDISWDLAQAGGRPSAEKATTSYNGLQIDARNGKFSPRATGDTQVNNGTIIYIPLYQDIKGATLKVSGNANGQTLTLDGQSITLGTPIMLDATTARYLKLTVTGTGSAYLTGIDLDYLSDDSYQTHVVKVGANEQYQTIQSALDANQSSLKDRLVLEIDPGTYTEAVQVNKPGVIFKNADLTGQKAVVITYNNYSSNTFDANGNFVPQDSHDLGTSKCGTVIVTAAATGFSAENITFENSYNVTDHTKEGEQTPAVAFDSLADQVYLKNCSLIGRQDTVYLQGKGNRVYINGGKIEGTVDFVFGDANALIENATINMAYYNGRKTGYFTAPNTAKGQTGLVFNNCHLTVDGQYGSNAAIYLARPWQTTIQTTSKVVNGKMIITAYDPNTKDSRYTDTSSAVTFINCQLPTNLAQNVFGVWTGKYEDASGKQSTVDITYHPDVRFIEFNNSTTADKKSLMDEKGNVLGTIQTGDASAYLKQVMSEMKIGTTAGAWQPVDKL